MNFFRKNARIYKDENGYNRFENSGKSVHRWAAEKKLGRTLKDGEVVHHKDRNKSNNRPDNLHVFPNQQTHWKAHKIDASKFGIKFSLMGKRKKR